MKRPPVYRPASARGAAERERVYDARRGSAGQRLYGATWRRAREAYLGAHPLCVMCLADDVTEAATVVDHKRAHKGDAILFWDQANWQALCKPHHDREAQIRDRGRGHRNRCG